MAAPSAGRPARALRRRRGPLKSAGGLGIAGFPRQLWIYRARARRWNTFGSNSASSSNRLAAPDGDFWPCSQARTVDAVTLSKAANTGWLT